MRRARAGLLLELLLEVQSYWPEQALFLSSQMGYFSL